MNFIKRSALSLLYHFKTNILLAFIVTAAATLIFSGLCIRAASVKSSEVIRRELGGTVILHAKDTNDNGTYKPISYDDASAIAKLPQVQDYNIESLTYAYAANFHTIDEKDANNLGQNIVLIGLQNVALIDKFSEKKTVMASGREITPADAGNGEICRKINTFTNYLELVRIVFCYKTYRNTHLSFIIVWNIYSFRNINGIVVVIFRIFFGVIFLY